MTTFVSTSATAEWLARDEAALAGVLSRTFGIVAVAGRGAWLTDVEGRRFLDLTMGIAVNNIGHCHPRVVAAAEQQLRRLMHTSVTVHQQRNVELAERLAQLCPFLDEPQVFFCNTGAEAVEGAMKLARRPPPPRRRLADDGQGQVPPGLRAARRRHHDRAVRLSAASRWGGGRHRRRSRRARRDPRLAGAAVVGGRHGGRARPG